MKVTVQLTEQDYVSTLWPALFSNRRSVAVLFLAGISTLVSLGYNIADLSRGEAVDPSRWLYVVVMALLAWAIFFVTPSKMRKTFHAEKLHERPSEVELEEEEFKSTDARGHTALKWSEIPKWRQTKSMIMVYMTERQCFLLPRHAFASQEDFGAAVAILQSKLGPST